jgi:hypothetical protein
MDAVAFGNKLLHLLSIITVVGGLAIMRLAVMPALQTAGADASDAAKLVYRRYGIVIGIAWIIALLTGFANMALVSEHANKSYHILLGMKMAIALFMFFLTMAIVHPMPALSGMQSFRGPVMVILLILAVIIVGMSAQLNMSRVSGKGLDTREPTVLGRPAG